MFPYWYGNASRNCWIRAGVFSARNVRKSLGDKPKLSRLSRRIPFLDSSLLFKGKAATLLGSFGNYIEASSSPNVSTREARGRKGWRFASGVTGGRF